MERAFIDRVSALSDEVEKLKRDRRDLIEMLDLIEVDLEAGDLPPRIRVPLALRRVKACIARYAATPEPRHD